MDGGRLFEHPRQARWTGSRALAVIDPGCPECGGPVVERTATQGALFVFGGFGADQRTTWSVCVSPACRWSHNRVIEELPPAYRPARL